MILRHCFIEKPNTKHLFLEARKSEYIFISLKQVVNGYFVHMFAPKDFKPLSKDVMFVLDKSGSMSGRKIIQLKEAMKLIMLDMNPTDRFNILFFDHSLDWLSKTDMLQGTKVNFGSAERFIEAVTARGSK